MPIKKVRQFLKNFYVSDSEIKSAYPFLKKRGIKHPVLLKKEKFHTFSQKQFFDHFDVEYLPNLFF